MNIETSDNHNIETCKCARAAVHDGLFSGS